MPDQDQGTFLKLAVEAPLLQPLTYKTTENFQRGQSVIVPLGPRKTKAVILGQGEPSTEFEIKNIESLNPSRPAISAAYMQWLEWIAEYYVHPIGLVTSLAFAPLDKKISNRKSQKTAIVPDTEKSLPPTLTEEQMTCVQGIRQEKSFSAHLLHGVTGSGKTEVYLRLLEENLKAGKTGLVLVPEISLTPQLIQRFAARFGNQMAVIHSHLTDRERTTQWWSIVDGEKKILIGARSALFCPMNDLGMIIVDEEHEPSYKQEEKLRYHARDAAIMLAKVHNIPIVLGTATPSLESWLNAQSGKYKLHTMNHRVSERSLPSVQIVDLRAEKDVRKESGTSDLPFWLSRTLHTEMTAALERQEQVALFLNRRGMAHTVLCPDCGYVERCPNCAITLTLHGKSHLVCHYCDYSISMATNCSSCKTGELKSLGIGTEQIETELPKLFPHARIARADRDEIHSRETLEEMIRKMENHEIDILVGTQMIAKGLDFKKLTLVGLVQADVGFNMPDFRAQERSFQLLTQVSGRAGRHIASGGRVVIQTYNPEYPVLPFTQTADFRGFAEYELKSRQELGYPPYGKIAAIKIVANELQKGEQLADRAAHRARLLQSQNPGYQNLQVLGPAEAPLAKLRGKFRFHLLLKCPQSAVLSAFCRRLIGSGDWIPSGCKVQIDIDPLNLM